MARLLILAEQAAVEAQAPTDGLLHTLLQNAFYLGLLFVFLVAVIGAFIAARKRDRCLKKFKNHLVTIHEQAGRRIWGLLKVFSKGLELVYESPFDRPTKTSFLIYEAELGKILSIHRFVDRLDDKGRRRRERQARKLAAPPLWARLARWARNIVNTFRDAIVSAMGMSIQQAAKTTPNPVLQAQSGQINVIGSMLIGETANAYEPMIEQYIGRPVILEVTNPADPDKRVAEYHGYLGEYSARFVLLVNVRDRFTETVPLGASADFVEGGVRLQADPAAIHVENRSAVPVIIEGVTVAGVCHEINRTVAPGETADVTVPEAASVEPPPPPPTIAVSWQREFDLIVPRAVGIIRHASDAPNT